MNRGHLGRCCLVAGLFALSPGNVSSQQLSGEIVSREVKSENDVTITYNLKGVKGLEYDVELFLVWGADYRKKLGKTTGDVGPGVPTGMGKTIHWDMKAELPDAIEGMSYRFELDVTLSQGGGFAWYWYAGAAVVTGGVVYLATKSSTGGGATITPVSPTVPLPPGR